MKKRLTILLIFLATAFFVSGFIANSTVVNERNTAENTASDTFSLQAEAEEYAWRNFTMDQPDSILNVVMEANASVQFYVVVDGSTQFHKYENRLNHNFLLTQPGQLTVRLRNNNSDIAIRVQYSMDLKIFYVQITRPYSWLLTPTLVSGLAVLSFIFLINFRGIRKRWNRTITEVILFSVAAILLVGFVPILGVVLGTAHPLVVTTTPSMEPAIWPGDLIVMARADAKQLEVGEIILYDTIVPPDFDRTAGGKITVAILHRINQTLTVNGSRYFIMKGDANPDPDLWYDNRPYLIPEEGVLGKVIYIIPKPTGDIYLMLSRIEVKALIVALVVAVVFLWPSKKKQPEVKKNQEQVPVRVCPSGSNRCSVFVR